jgi:hypothetical protein
MTTIHLASPAPKVRESPFWTPITPQTGSFFGSGAKLVQ